MRKLIKIALVVLGISAFLRWRKKHKAQAELDAATPTPPPLDPADQLREKLAESRADDTGVETEEPPEAPVADRRAEVHEQGRATIDEMTSSDEA